MEHTALLKFLPPEELQEKVKGIFEREAWVIRGNFPDTYMDIQEVGSTAIPGAWGKFDVDIQIRIFQKDFEDVVLFMKGYGEAKNTDCWTNQYALFNDPKDIIDYNVTVIDSKHDIFQHIRDYLKEDTDAFQEYMELKMSYQGKLYSEYRVVRYAFFKDIRKRVRILKNLPE